MKCDRQNRLGATPGATTCKIRLCRGKQRNRQAPKRIIRPEFDLRCQLTGPRAG